MNGEDTRDAAYDFIRKMGIDPTPDAVSQLSGPFAEALRVMCTRRYEDEPGTELWRSKGWKGLVHDILNKAGRIKYHSWRRNNFDGDSAIDIINFSGFYWRMKNEGSKWGELGEPGLWKTGRSSPWTRSRRNYKRFSGRSLTGARTVVKFTSTATRQRLS